MDLRNLYRMDRRQLVRMHRPDRPLDLRITNGRRLEQDPVLRLVHELALP